MKADSMSTTATSPISFFRVYFKIHYHTENGKALYLVGDNKQLGNWNPEKGIRLQWNEVLSPLFLIRMMNGQHVLK